MINHHTQPSAASAFSPDRVRDLIAPIAIRLSQCVREAWSAWEALPPESKLGLEGRSRACFLSDKMRRSAKAAFPGRDGVEVVEKYGSFQIHIGSDLVLRMKKADSKGRTSNFPTRRQMTIWSNLGFSDSNPMAMVNIGYVLDRMGTAVEDIVVSYPARDGVGWVFSLDEPAAAVVQGPVPIERRPRVSPKPGAKILRRQKGKTA